MRRLAAALAAFGIGYALGALELWATKRMLTDERARTLVAVEDRIFELMPELKVRQARRDVGRAALAARR